MPPQNPALGFDPNLQQALLGGSAVQFPSDLLLAGVQGNELGNAIATAIRGTGPSGAVAQVNAPLSPVAFGGPPQQAQPFGGQPQQAQPFEGQPQQAQPESRPLPAFGDADREAIRQMGPQQLNRTRRQLQELGLLTPEIDNEFSRAFQRIGLGQ